MHTRSYSTPHAPLTWTMGLQSGVPVWGSSPVSSLSVPYVAFVFLSYGYRYLPCSRALLPRYDRPCIV